MARRHWPIAVILCVATLLLLTNLSQDYLWADEGDTAVLARSILRFGVPTAWDGVSFIDSDFGARLNDNLVMVSHPWLQYYVTAGSFALLGETTLAARLPFALFGLATIALTYVMVNRVAGNRWTAATAALLLTLSVQFLIYGRQSRHYTLNAALTCLLVMQFMRLDSWAGTARFAALGILLFHSHPIAIAPLLALGVLTLTYPPFADKRRWFWRAIPVVAAFTVPWLVIAGRGYAANMTVVSTASAFFPRIGQFAIECASVTSVVGVVVLLIATRWTGSRAPARGRRPRPARRAPALAAEERDLIVTLGAITAAYAVVMAFTQPRDTIWAIGLRYTPAIIPFMAMMAAILIARVGRGRWQPWLALVLIFGLTKAGRITPWTFWEPPRAMRDPSSAVTFHNPERPIDRVLRTGQLAFVRSLVEPNPGTMAGIVQYLGMHAASHDIVVTNYEWEPLYFHTGLAQGMTVLPTYPIYRAARAKGLPEYVFRPDGARWIVWRKAWGAYRGQRLDVVLGQLKEAGMPTTLVAQIPETLWENRENIHFRRFPGERYIYPWYKDVPETLIYRVDGSVQPAAAAR